MLLFCSTKASNLFAVIPVRTGDDLIEIAIINFLFDSWAKIHHYPLNVKKFFLKNY